MSSGPRGFFMTVFGMKRCPQCGETKSFADFNRHRARPDGCQACCRVCQRKEQAAWYAANREAKIARSVVVNRTIRRERRALAQAIERRQSRGDL